MADLSCTKRPYLGRILKKMKGCEGFCFASGRWHSTMQLFSKQKSADRRMRFERKARRIQSLRGSLARQMLPLCWCSFGPAIRPRDNSKVNFRRELQMDVSKIDRDDRQSQLSGQAQWASNYAWGFAAAAAIMAVLLWALFGK